MVGLQSLLFINLKIFKIMAHNVYFYPCTKSGKMLKGFCRTISDCAGLYHSIDNWKKFSAQFNFKISYYALSFDDVTYNIYRI